jgi:predicted TIM-barrel fold metal-dependent hydrolase
MIIDCHTHLDNIMHTRQFAEKRLQILLEVMKKNNVDRALVLAEVPIHPHEKIMSNEQLLKLIEPYKQLHLVGKVPLKDCQNKKYLKNLQGHIAAKRIVGIKLYPGYEKFYAHEKRYGKVFDLCEKFDIPVMIHAGDVMERGYLKYATPLHIDELATDRPELKIIICHMGNPWQLDTAAVAFKNENVYADTAGLFYRHIGKGERKFLHRKIEEFIQWNAKGEKLIFGSDWPITDVKDTVHLINELCLSKKEKHLIFCKNAMKLFKIK